MEYFIRAMLSPCAQWNQSWVSFLGWCTNELGGSFDNASISRIAELIFHEGQGIAVRLV